MAITTTSPMYKLKFTDGTFATMINVNNDTKPRYSIGKHEFIIPNFYFGDIDGSRRTYTKTDLNGNTYKFSYDRVVVNDTQTFTSEYHRFAFGYDPVAGTTHVIHIRPEITSAPRISGGGLGSNSVEAFAYGRNVSGTGWDSFGEVLARAEEIYDAWQPRQITDHWYQLENVVPRASNSPFASTTTWHGDPMLQTTLMNTLYWDLNGVSFAIDYDNSGSIEDYDPEVTPIIDDDPYDPDDPEDHIGGWGDHDDSSDPIDIPSLPSLSAVDAGFITLYNPTVGQLNALANYMWSSPLQVWDNVKKIVANPMDCILGLSIVPVTPIVGSPKTITVADVSTGVSARPITSQYVEVNCGSINVGEYWKAYLDYEPYTKAELYLPYIGIHPISVDDIMGKTVKVVYHVDLVSGSCTAYVKCGASVLYSFIGQCASSIPIGGKDWTNVISGALTIATAIGSMVASGGMSAPMAGEAAGEAAGAAANEAAMTRAAMIRTVGHAAATAVNVIKPSIGKSGSMSGTGGLMAIQKPYLILTRPRQAVPASQNHFMGYPSFMTAVIGTLSGYTEMEHVHLDGINATDNEIAEIEQLLKGGVYL